MKQSKTRAPQNKQKSPSVKPYDTPKMTLIFLGIIVFLYIVLRLNIINIPLDRDEGIFAYIGQVINDNGVPYKDAIDQKPPVVFFIYALALKLVPPTSAGIHLFLHFYNLLTLVILFFAVKIYSNSRFMALWTAFTYAVISSCPDLQGFTASTEMFMLLPISLSLLFIILAIRKERYSYYILSGVCGALTFWTKQTGAFVILFIVIYFISVSIQNIHQKKKTLLNAIKELLLWGSGFILITLLFAGYFYLHNAFDEFVYWSFTHSFIYGKRVNVFMMFPQIARILQDIFKGNFMIIVPGVIGCLIMIIKKDQKGLWALVFLLFSFLATCPGYAYRHYFAQFVPGVAVACGIGIFYLVQLSPKKIKCAFSLFLICSIIITPLFVHFDYYIKNSPDETSRQYFGANPFPESVDLGKYIKERTGEKDTVFIFGSEAQIFVYSQRKSATSFALIYPLMSSYPKYKEFQQQTWKDIQKNKPEYIIFVGLPTSFLYDGKADLWILKKTIELISGEYNLEAVMTINHPKGRLIKIAEMRNANETLAQQHFPIQIFRKKGE